MSGKFKRRNSFKKLTRVIKSITLTKKFIAGFESKHDFSVEEKLIEGSAFDFKRHLFCLFYWTCVIISPLPVLSLFWDFYYYVIKRKHKIIEPKITYILQAVFFNFLVHVIFGSLGFIF